MIELIDTCWDVNRIHEYGRDTSNVELIDTCWDVNISSYSMDALIKGINRYMLGCKFNVPDSDLTDTS